MLSYLNFFGKSEPPEAPPLPNRFESTISLAPLRLVVKKIHDKRDSLQAELDQMKNIKEDVNSKNKKEETEKKLTDLKFLITKIDEEINAFNNGYHKKITTLLIALSSALINVRTENLAIARGASKEYAKYAVDTVFGENTAKKDTYFAYVGNYLKDTFRLHSAEPDSLQLYNELVETLNSLMDNNLKNTLK